MKIVEHNIVQQIYSATLDSATENNTTIDSTTSTIGTWNSEKLRQYNINTEIRNSATLTSGTLNRARWKVTTSNNEY